jgi:O-antigen ligase
MNQQISIGWWRRADVESASSFVSVSRAQTVHGGPIGVADASIGLPTALLGAYVVMYMVPISDMLANLGARVPVVVLTGVILTAALPFVGPIGRFWKTTIARPWMTLLALFFLAAIFGQYPRRSVPFIGQVGLRLHLLPYYFCAIAGSTRRVRHVLYWAAGGTILLLTVCGLSGQVLDGRLGIPQTVLANPNDLAFSILLGMPCLLLLAYSSLLGRVLSLTAFAIAVLAILRTGSRASFVTLPVVTVAAFYLVRRGSKIIMLAIASGVAVMMLVMVPPQTWRRLTLIVADPVQTRVADQLLQGAVDSQAARTELQRRAVQLIARHPLLGVGPLMFPDAADAMVRRQTGQRTQWQVAHNTYLEIAAENGIPALIFYVWTLAWCVKVNYRVYRTCQTQPSQRMNTPQALCLLLMTVAFTVGILFSNAAYLPIADVVIGLSAANVLAVESELEEFRLSGAR